MNENIHLVQCSRGIRIASGEQSELSERMTIQKVLNFPFNAYFLNTESQIQAINTCSALTSGFDCTKSAIGRSVRDVQPKHLSEALIHVDHNVIQHQVTQFSDDLMVDKEGTMHQFISVKTPLFDARGKVMGIIGCSILLNKHSIADAFKLMTQLGMLHTITPLAMINIGSQLSNHKRRLTYLGIQFTPRESQIIYYLVRGKSAAKTAELLTLSKRTVEYYIINIKNKLGVNSKSDIIERFYPSGSPP